MVFGPGQSVNRTSLGDSPQTRSVDSSSGNNLAPSVGFMEAMGVAPERNGLMCSGLSAETTDTIINSIAPSKTRLRFQMEALYSVVYTTCSGPSSLPHWFSTRVSSESFF